MKTLIAILTITMLTGCGIQIGPVSKEVKIVPEAQPYVTQFEVEGTRLRGPTKIDSLVVMFDESLSGTSTLGVCRRGGGKAPTITLNPKFWFSTYYLGNYVSNSIREALVFHELGHCILNRGHLDTKAPTLDYNVNTPVSVMTAYMLYQSQYEVNHEHYLQELFGVDPTLALYSYGSSQFITSYPAAVMPTNPTASTMAKAELNEDDGATVVYTTSVDDVIGEDGLIKLGCAEDHSH